MSTTERSSIENGIWLCYTHGKLIDTDEVRFTVEHLRRWKVIAELAANLEQHERLDYAHARELAGAGDLVPNLISIFDVSNLNLIIGNAIADSCIPGAWGGDLTGAIRDCLIEVARNALTHGSATSVTLDITTSSIKLTDDGAPFDTLALPSHPKGRGGAIAVRELIVKHGDRLFVDARQVANNNHVIIAAVSRSQDVLALTPCAREIDIQTLREDVSVLAYPATCHTMYMVLPRFFSLSDVFELHTAIISREMRTERIVFVVDGVSHLVRRYLSNLFPGCRILTA